MADLITLVILNLLPLGILLGAVAFYLVPPVELALDDEEFLAVPMDLDFVVTCFQGDAVDALLAELGVEGLEVSGLGCRPFTGQLVAFIDDVVPDPLAVPRSALNAASVDREIVFMIDDQVVEAANRRDGLDNAETVVDYVEPVTSILIQDEELNLDELVSWACQQEADNFLDAEDNFLFAWDNDSMAYADTEVLS